MERYKYKMLAWGITLVMIINMTPIQILAIEVNGGNTTQIVQPEEGMQIDVPTTTCGGLMITGSTNAYEYKDNIVRIIGSERLIVKNIDQDKPITDQISVLEGVKANIILNGINIDVSGEESWTCAFEVLGEANITLADDTKNILKSTDRKSGLQVEGNAIITIQGEVASTGSLKAIGGFRGSGIGGGYTGTGGTIQIRGGNVTAQGGPDGAGIGGGYAGLGGTIEISGGSVLANGGAYGSGIGGGHFAAGGTIEISGGVVIANGGVGGSNGEGGAGIGGGRNGAGGTIQIRGGDVTAQGGPDGAGIGGGYAGAGGRIQISGGTPIIRTSSIQDEKDSWEGIIFEGSTGRVYGEKQILKENLTIKESETLVIDTGITLIVDEGVMLINNGTLINNGILKGDGILQGAGSFKIEILTPQHIVDIPNQVYTGGQIKPSVIIDNVVMGKFFDIDSINIDDWNKAYVDNIDVGMGTIILSKEGEATVKKSFKIVQLDTSFGDHGIKTYKNGKEETMFYYGDEITITVTPEITNIVPSSKMMSSMRTFPPSKENEIALFIGEGEDEIQITESQPAEMGKELTFTISTTDKTISASYFRDSEQTITAKYIGNNNIASHLESTNITLKRISLSWGTEGKVKNKSYDSRMDTIIEEEPTLNGILKLQ